MHASTEDKKPFNLSRWAIGHPSIARFLLALIIITGGLGLLRMGQREIGIHVPRHGGASRMAGSFHPGNGDQVVNKIERKPAGNAASRFRPFLYARRQRHSSQSRSKATTDADEVADALLPGAQEGGRPSPTSCPGRARPISTMSSATPLSPCIRSAATASAIPN